MRTDYVIGSFAFSLKRTQLEYSALSFVGGIIGVIWGNSCVQRVEGGAAHVAVRFESWPAHKINTVLWLVRICFWPSVTVNDDPKDDKSRWNLVFYVNYPTLPTHSGWHSRLQVDIKLTRLIPKQWLARKQTFWHTMPRLVTPFSNPYAHGSHTLTPYSRQQRSSMSPSSSDKENAVPEEPQPSQKPLASQAALRQKLGESSNTQYYDPFQPREKVRDVTARYRRMLAETNGRMVLFTADKRMSWRAC